MFHHGLHTGFTKRASFHWYLLSFLAGSVNAGGFLVCERFVTHTTGFATLSGIALAKGEYVNALAMLTVPLFFLAGVMVAAFLTESRRQRGLRPHYAATMWLVALCLFTVAIGGNYAAFGVFGRGFHARHDYVLLALLCMASGLQNAAISTSSGATVRTTHLTGITTDLGIGLVRAIECRKNPTQSSEEGRKNRLRSLTVASFLLGGTAGATLFLRIQYLGFIMPMAIAVYAAVIAKRYSPPTPQVVKR